MRRHLLIVAALVAALAFAGWRISSREAPPAPDSSPPRLGDAGFDPGTRDFSVLVVGDSLSVALGLGMVQALEGDDRGIQVASAGKGGCGLLLSVQQRRMGVLEDTPTECGAWREEWPDLVRRHRPDAVYLTTSFWDGLSKQVLEPGGDEGGLSDPWIRDRYLENADRAIGILTAGGARVYLDDVNREEEKMAGVTAEVVAAHPELARLVPVYEEMCYADGRCPDTIDGIDVLDDTWHPAGESAERLARFILNFIARDLAAG